MSGFKKIVQSKGFFVILSILLAVLSWLLVLNNTNPIKERTLEIPLTVLNGNHPATLDLSDQTVARPETVTVTVSGRQDTINNLTVKELYASVDMKEIKQTGKTSLKVSKPECSRLGISVEDYYPKEIEFVFDTQSQRYLDVVVEYDDSLLEDNYEYISVVAEPDKIPVVGLTNVIDNIAHIKVDLTDAISEKSINGDKTASFIGKYISVMGEDITSSFTTEKVTVHITVAKRVPIIYKVSGIPDSNFYYESDSISMDTVLIQGDAATMAKINQINLGTVDITNATATVSKEFDVSQLLPEGVTVYGSSETTVTAKIVKYSTKSITIKSSDVSYSGKDTATYIYTIGPDAITILIKGKAVDIASITATSLSPTIDLSNRTVGDYNILLQFKSLDINKVTVVGDYSFHVVIENIPVVEPEIPDTPSDDPEVPTVTPPETQSA